MILLDYKDSRPIYEQLVEKLQEMMLLGILEEDSQMPSVRSLATELSINPNTIQKAYTILEQQGYIYPVKGRGNFVSGSRNLVEQKKDNFFQKLRIVIREGIELGVTKEECVSRTAALYEEVSHD